MLRVVADGVVLSFHFPVFSSFYFLSFPIDLSLSHECVVMGTVLRRVIYICRGLIPLLPAQTGRVVSLLVYFRRVRLVELA